jgi:hypothetical protein
MKNMIKLVLATVAVSSIVSVSVLADDVRTIERYNNHGTGTIVYRQCDQSAQYPSVAVYSRGQGVGYSAPGDSASSTRLRLTENAHGSTHFQYRAE